MSTLPELRGDLRDAETHGQPSDDFAALEERVLRLIDLLRTERRERARADENAATLQQLLDEQGEHVAHLQDELKVLSNERDQVRTRVERLLTQLEEFGG